MLAAASSRERFAPSNARRCAASRHISRVVFKTMLRAEKAGAGQVLQADFSADAIGIVFAFTIM